MKLRSIAVSVAALAMACGPNARQTPGDDDDGSNGSNGGRRRWRRYVLDE
jgi:hypothetical protein